MRYFSTCIALAVLVTGGAAPLCAQADADAADQVLDSLLNLKVSSAAKYEQTRSNAPASITIISEEEIERYGYRTLQEVINAVPGFYVSDDRTYGYIGVRGFGRPATYNNRILVLVDGHSTNEGLSGGARVGSGFGIELEDVERIEIVRGPGSALYGTRAMLAVVNVMTKRGRSQRGATFLSGLGSLGTRRLWGRLATPVGSDLEVVASGALARVAGTNLYFPEFDDPASNNGVAENLDWHEYRRARLGAQYRGFTLQGGYSSRDKGIPTAIYGSAFNNPAARMGDSWAFLDLGYQTEDAHPLQLSLDFTFDSYRNFGDTPYEIGPVVRHSNKAKEVSGEARVRWDPRPNHRLVIGTQVRRFFEITMRSWHPFGTVYDINAPYTVGSFFAQHEFEISDRLTSTLGLRHDAYASTGSATTPRVALVFQASPTTALKLLYGEAFRAPNTLELHLQAPQALLLANPDLLPERIRTFEAVLEQGMGRYVLATATLFRNDMRDLIDLTVIRAPDSLTGFGPFMAQYRNRSKVRALGVELGLRAMLPVGVWAYANYTYQDAQDGLTQQAITNSPRHLIKTGISGTVARMLTLAGGVRYESSRLTLAGTETDDFAVVDVAVNSTPLFGPLSLHAAVKNLFDTEYYAPGGMQHQPGAVIQPCRTVILEVRGHW